VQFCDDAEHFVFEGPSAHVEVTAAVAQDSTLSANGRSRLTVQAFSMVDSSALDVQAILLPAIGARPMTTGILVGRARKWTVPAGAYLLRLQCLWCEPRQDTLTLAPGLDYHVSGYLRLAVRSEHVSSCPKD
jgi:hypothetical protein